jgi:hypothetical protein
MKAQTKRLKEDALAGNLNIVYGQGAVIIQENFYGLR